MALTREEVRTIAELARLCLTPEEEVRYAETISAVLEYMNILNEVDTTDVEPTAQVTGLENVTREDVAVPSATLPAAFLAGMPKVERGELVVPGVFDDK